MAITKKLLQTQQSKKNSILSKGKALLPATTAQEPDDDSESEDDEDFEETMLDDDEEGSSQDEDDEDEEDEEEDDVTEEAMARMMELLGDDADGLLGEEEEMSEDEEGLEAGEGDEEEEVDDDDEEEEDDEEDLDEEAVEALFEELEEDDTDLVPVEKTTVNDKVALERVLASFKIPTTFFDTLTLTNPKAINVPDAENDLERELEFYKQSLWAATEARRLFAASDVPFSRPADYFAEMLKSDSHMTRIRQSLLDESAGIKASEDARKLRDAKKFGKKVQVERLKEREKEKKEVGKRLEGLKKKRKNGESFSTEDFDIALEDAIAGPSKRQKVNESERGGRGGSRGGGRGGRGDGGRRGMSRQGRDSKFGNPTTSRRPKENNDKMDGEGYGKRRGGRGGARGGRGGGRGGGGGGGRGGSKRLGKSRRS